MQDRPESPDPIAPAAPDGTLELVTRLAEALAREGVRYCHWKSNEAIARSLSGDNDLDLLVDRADSTRFFAVLSSLGFRAAYPSDDRRVPGLVDLYGADEATGRIVHVQAHFSLVLGDDMTKNFRLPVEDAFLESVDRHEVLPLPSAEFEWIVFVVRMAAKHCPWDAQLAGKGGLAASEARELAFLRERIDHRRVDEILTTRLPFLPAGLFAECVAAVLGDRPPPARAIVAARLALALRGSDRRSPLHDLLLRVWRRTFRRVEGRIPGRSRRRRLETGGLLIAVVGSDGSGKSTVVDHLHRELSRHLVTRRVHLGKPPRSLTSRAVRRLLGRLRDQALVPGTGMPARSGGSRKAALVHAVWHLLIARDRVAEWVRARRAVAGGAVVVSDRFPIEGLESMDGPRIGRALAEGGDGVVRLLAERERRLYRRIGPPDLLIVLRVRPETAVGRRPEQDPDWVRLRASEVWERDWERDGAVVVDADQPLDEVIGEVRRVVWSLL